MTNKDPVMVEDLNGLDEYVTEILRTQQELLSEIKKTTREVEKLRVDVNELKQQVPPQLRKL